MTNLRFPKAINNFRPYKSHRYDVFGLKVNRTLTLFDPPALYTWLQLEADPLVLSYCERPAVIPDTTPKQIIDFWVAYSSREEFWLLQSGKVKPQPDKLTMPLPAFTAWATSQRLFVRHVQPMNRFEHTHFLDNWGRIVRTLSANRRYLTSQLLKRVLDYMAGMAEPQSLSHLMQIYPDEDPALVHTAVFSLIHAGKLRCSDIDSQPLGPGSMVVVA
ncbi:hypothetical protein [Noviherbaspirillum aerium]|uniref:hypothetical protein n=1 Tax=Noviherbaspirillum aerium TaxID=2588497 RepID=UPI00124E9E74|nr:hypothetical protein [Noviherbaspirillum aerium]